MAALGFLKAGLDHGAKAVCSCLTWLRATTLRELTYLGETLDEVHELPAHYEAAINERMNLADSAPLNSTNTPNDETNKPTGGAFSISFERTLDEEVLVDLILRRHVDHDEPA